MFKKLERPCVLLLALTAYSAAEAADIRFNGFASLAGGRTFNEGSTRFNSIIVDPATDLANGIIATSGDFNSTYLADRITVGVYDDDWSFRPDTSYGLQVTADAGHGLTVVGQITGNGGENFDANIAWAYVAYDFNENFRLTVGRQRTPLFYYSDFFDVAYAYHWVRPPQELAASDFDTYEGVKLRWTTLAGNVDLATEVFAGSASETINTGSGVEFENQIGISITGTYDWLTLRGQYSQADLIIDNPTLTAISGQGTDEDPIPGVLAGLAANMDFGNYFIIGEYTISPVEDPVYPEFGIRGIDGTVGWYLSAGLRLGSVTPHITYSEETIDYTEFVGDLSFTVQPFPFLTGEVEKYQSKREAWTIGIRWDFHPSAAFKAEYLTRADKSDDYFKNSAGQFGYGEPGKVDLLTFSLDVLF